ncbi:unnamed protein product [Spirodela intermedia]|uniref:Uncharacterized protein n=1 Tax=Spirodela intermedia TaxID=51605 RepID=A0A7I8JRL9_SPIIN|nr:unnamed protein product [Spirodela intermedia]CAA6672769.1 unnamed protein product [Spirodela intermedia]
MRVVSSDHHSLDRIDPTKVDPEYVLKTPSEPPIAEEQVLFPWLYPFSFLFLNFSCGMGIYSTSENETFLGFIISDYLIFLVCFFVLRRLEGNGATVRDKRRKVSSRYCSVAVSVYFLFQIATVLPRTLATVVWTVAGRSSRRIATASTYISRPSGLNRSDDTCRCLPVLRIRFTRGRRRQLPPVV